MIVFEKGGLLTTVQDEGRPGMAFYGIPHGGAMDRESAHRANLLVGNPGNHPVFECTWVGPTLKFETDTVIGIAGADMQWQLNSNPIVPGKAYKVSKGDTLSASGTKDVFRGYLAVRGKIKTHSSFGSFSTDPQVGMGGNEGRAIQAGDAFEIIDTQADYYPASWQYKNLPARHVFALHPGPESEVLHPDAAKQLQQAEFKLAKDTNRMAARLHGPVLDHTPSPLQHSVPLLPGFVQLLPSGQLVVILQDGQTTGGYPRIAYLTEPDLDRFNQVVIGHYLRFALEDKAD